MGERLDERAGRTKTPPLRPKQKQERMTVNNALTAIPGDGALVRPHGAAARAFADHVGKPFAHKLAGVVLNGNATRVLLALGDVHSVGRAHGDDDKKRTLIM